MKETKTPNSSCPLWFEFLPIQKGQRNASMLSQSTIRVSLAIIAKHCSLSSTELATTRNYHFVVPSTSKIYKENLESKFRRMTILTYLVKIATVATFLFMTPLSLHCFSTPYSNLENQISTSCGPHCYSLLCHHPVCCRLCLLLLLHHHPPCHRLDPCYHLL